MEDYPTTSSSGPSSAQRRACANCSHAKAKCVPSETPGRRCQRCERLQKKCEPTFARTRPLARKRKTPETTRVSKSHVEKLEEKLDGLVTLLKTAHETGAQQSFPIASSSSLDTKEELHNPSGMLSIQPMANLSLREHVPAWDVNPQRENGTMPQESPASPYSIPQHRTSSDLKGPRQLQFELDDFDLGSEDPDELLAIFRNEMSPNFPFITLTEFPRAEDLRRDRPTLYTAILSVTTRNTPLANALSQAFLKQLAERMVVNGERNMDLLLGCLTYAAWRQDLLNRGHYITSMLGSVATIASDLGMNRPTFRDTPGLFERLVRSFGNIPDFKDSVGTREERRAFLGYFYLCSVFCGFGRRLDTLPWTPYLEECCRILNAPGSPIEDKSAVMLARIQMIAQRIGQNPWEGRQDFTGSTPPPLLYLKTLQNQIQKLKDECDPVLAAETIVNLTYHNSQVLSYKIGLSKSPAVLSFTDRDFDRLQYLSACLTAVKSLLDIYTGMPVENFHTITVPMILQLTWNCGHLQMLSSFEHPDWDLALVSETISLFDVMEKIVHKLSQAKSVLGYDPQTTEGLDWFSQSATTVINVKSFFEGKVEEPKQGDPPQQEHRNVETPNFQNFTPVGEFMDFMDDVWMRDAMSFSDSQGMGGRWDS